MSLSITGHTGLLGLFAHPCAHSKSPRMHNTAFQALGLDYVYLAFDVDGSNLKEAVDSLRTLGMKGVNLSMPNKVLVLPYLDALSPEAELAGTVNTIVNENGKLTGHSTDGVGWMWAVRDLGVDLIGKKMTIVGTGGAAKSIIAQAALDGVGEISIFNRKSPRWAEAEALAQRIGEKTKCRIHLYELNTADEECMARLKQEIAESVLLANTTNVGMGHLEGQTFIPDPSYFHEGLAVTDAIYHPKETELLRMAREAGCLTQNGDRMLFYQGAAAFKIWTGQDMPLETVKPVMGL